MASVRGDLKNLDFWRSTVQGEAPAIQAFELPKTTEITVGANHKNLSPEGQIYNADSSKKYLAEFLFSPDQHKKESADSFNPSREQCKIAEIIFANLKPERLLGAYPHLINRLFFNGEYAFIHPVVSVQGNEKFIEIKTRFDVHFNGLSAERSWLENPSDQKDLVLYTLHVDYKFCFSDQGELTRVHLTRTGLAEKDNLIPKIREEFLKKGGEKAVEVLSGLNDALLGNLPSLLHVLEAPSFKIKAEEPAHKTESDVSSPSALQLWREGDAVLAEEERSPFWGIFYDQMMNRSMKAVESLTGKKAREATLNAWSQKADETASRWGQAMRAESEEALARMKAWWKKPEPTSAEGEPVAVVEAAQADATPVAAAAAPSEPASFWQQWGFGKR